MPKRVFILKLKQFLLIANAIINKDIRKIKKLINVTQSDCVTFIG